MNGFAFQLTQTDGAARAGELHTPHGSALTPLFMPVATQATVKGLTPEEVAGAGAQVVLSNAYHLYLRPGVETVESLGGLHRFMGWQGPILTDSGGFQAFSMGPLRKIEDTGIRFRSHLDGSAHHFTPELATTNQVRLGADIVMCLDQCIVYGASEQQVRQAMERTHRWAKECFALHEASGASMRQALFGIVQGGTFEKLRDESARVIAEIPFHGYAVGGLAVGETKEQLYEFAGQVAALLPAEQAPVLDGSGVAGRLGGGRCPRHRHVRLRPAHQGGPQRGPVHAGGAGRRHQEPLRRYRCPLGRSLRLLYLPELLCVAYLHHLFRAKELLGLRLASVHNLRFVLRLMQEIRRAVVEGRFESFRKEFFDRYHPTNAKARDEQKLRWIKDRGV